MANSKGRSLHTMQKAMTRILLSCAVIVALSGASALADDALLRSSVIGSNPRVLIGGVASGGAPWKGHEGNASLHHEGRMRGKIEGLVPVPPGTPGPITQVTARLGRRGP